MGCGIYVPISKGREVGVDAILITSAEKRVAAIDPQGGGVRTLSERDAIALRYVEPKEEREDHPSRRDPRALGRVTRLCR